MRNPIVRSVATALAFTALLAGCNKLGLDKLGLGQPAHSDQLPTARQLESIAEIEEAEALVADIQEHRVPERIVTERIVTERAPERHIMPERHIAQERIMVQEPAAATAQPARIADRLAFAVVKASQASPQLKR